MNAAELAALIAAVFWAVLVCVGVFVISGCSLARRPGGPGPGVS